MRQFGPADPVTLAAIRQTGAAEVVAALHEIPNGAVWPRDAIAARHAMIADAGLDWTVVESLPVDDEIKRRGPAWDARIAAWRESLTHLAACGIRVVTYNFMPLLDWTRTEAAAR
ncbi:mannonate dehydratase [Sphingomonas sp. RP10(2022)]|uniref:mannonate dehydratase n=1 Tax=Sphingomonas liriopis TaxID=2949094 RepID=A0A9X2HNI6_9SPHN|nr:mannonate dehydratase [Sphingomonas liriopis]MCP3733472.1 mannonate dehydratase [Sphingomonas liriopis]